MVTKILVCSGRRTGTKRLKRHGHMHQRCKSESLGKEPDVVFIGDSIVAYLPNFPIWNDLFVPLHCLNFGIGGDGTENVIWRIKDGIFANIKPKAVVVHIGTNNCTRAPKDVGEGVIEIVRLIREILTDTHIIVLSILPRGEHDNKIRTFAEEVNKFLENKLSNVQKSMFLEIGSDLLQPDGTISHLDSPDYLHLSGSGYMKTYAKVYEPLKKILAKAA